MEKTISDIENQYESDKQKLLSNDNRTLLTPSGNNKQPEITVSRRASRMVGKNDAPIDNATIGISGNFGDTNGKQLQAADGEQDDVQYDYEADNQEELLKKQEQEKEEHQRIEDLKEADEEVDIIKNRLEDKDDLINQDDGEAEVCELAKSLIIKALYGKPTAQGTTRRVLDMDFMDRAYDLLTWYINNKSRGKAQIFKLRSEIYMRLDRFIQALNDMDEAAQIDQSVDFDTAKSCEQHYAITKSLMRLSNDI